LDVSRGYTALFSVNRRQIRHVARLRQGATNRPRQGAANAGTSVRRP
jgi:hypothetical protein